MNMEYLYTDFFDQSCSFPHRDHLLDSHLSISFLGMLMETVFFISNSTCHCLAVVQYPAIL